MGKPRAKSKYSDPKPDKSEDLQDKIDNLRLDTLKAIRDFVEWLTKQALDEESGVSLQQVKSVKELLELQMKVLKEIYEQSDEAKFKNMEEMARMITVAKTLTPDIAVSMLLSKNFGGLLEYHANTVEVEELKNANAEYEAAVETLRKFDIPGFDGAISDTSSEKTGE